MIFANRLLSAYEYFPKFLSWLSAWIHRIRNIVVAQSGAGGALKKLRLYNFHWRAQPYRRYCGTHIIPLLWKRRQEAGQYTVWRGLKCWLRLQVLVKHNMHCIDSNSSVKCSKIGEHTIGPVSHQLYLLTVDNQLGENIYHSTNTCVSSRRRS
jgi:hypothetical protein